MTPSDSPPSDIPAAPAAFDAKAAIRSAIDATPPLTVKQIGKLADAIDEAGVRVQVGDMVRNAASELGNPDALRAGRTHLDSLREAIAEVDRKPNTYPAGPGGR